MGSSTVLGVIVILVVIGGVAFAVPVVPITVQESYQTTETYEEQEPYTVQVPYTVEVEVIKTEYLVNLKNVEYASNWKYGILFDIDSTRELEIEWSCDKNVLLFIIMKSDFLGGLNSILTLAGTGFGLGGQVGTAIGPIGSATGAILGAIVGALYGVVDNYNYYSLQSNGDTKYIQLEEGEYAITILIVNAPVIFNAQVSYDYETTETETRYRTETKYRTVEKTRTVTKYRDVEKRITIFEALTG